MNQEMAEKLGHYKREVSTLNRKLEALQAENHRLENEMKKTKAALKELSNIGEFVGGFKRAKQSEPEVIYISKKQKETLGIEDGEKLLGKEWRVV